MEKLPLNVILLGDPASGKGTQAERIEKLYGLYNLDMGREIRRPAMRKKFDYAKTTAMGKLTPTAVVGEVFTHIIRRVPSKQGILLNGTPKMINEAKLVKRLFKQHGRRDPVVIYLTIPTAEVIRRMEKRTEYLDGKLVRRDDDTVRALKNRRKYYKDQVSQVVLFFKKNYTVKSVSGMGSESVVAERIANVIKRYIKTHGT